MVNDWGKHYIKRWTIGTVIFVLWYIFSFVVFYLNGYVGVALVCWICGGYLYNIIFCIYYFEIKKKYRNWRNKKWKMKL